MPILVADSKTLAGLAKKHWDVVIVGSGISGATACWRLQNSAAKDLDVLIIDKAGLPPNNHSPMGSAPDGPKTYLGTPEGGKEIQAWWDAKQVGGGFNVWYGQIGRFHANSLQKSTLPFGATRSKAVSKWPIRYDELIPYYDVIEKALAPYAASEGTFEQTGNTVPLENVTTRPRISEFEARFGRKLSQFGLDCYVVPTCLGGRLWDKHPIDPITGKALTASDISGIKRGFKDDMLGAAKGRPNVTLLCAARVESLAETDGGGCLQVRSVQDTSSKEVTLSASKILLGCGALETARLLLGSPHISRGLPIGQGFNTTLEYIGYVSTDIARKAEPDPFARFGHLGMPVMNPATGGMGKIAIYDALEVDGYKKYCEYNKRFGTTVPISRRTFEQKYVLKLSFKGESANWPGKQITRRTKEPHALPDLWLRYDDHADDLSLLGYVQEQIRQIAATLVHGKVLFGFRPTKAFGLSAHHHGGAIMGDTPENSVTDRYGRLWGAEDISIIDSSTFPTSGDLNGSLTIMANAARVTDWAIHQETLS